MEVSKGPRRQEGKHIPTSNNAKRMEVSKGPRGQEGMHTLPNDKERMEISKQ
jgi:hypothetical protein